MAVKLVHFNQQSKSYSLSEKQLLELWEVLKNYQTYKQFEGILDKRLNDKAEQAKNLEDIVAFLSMLSSHKFYDVFIWNKAFLTLEKILNEENKASVRNSSEEIIASYKLLEHWGDFLINIAEEDTFKVEYYFKNYCNLSHQIYSNFFTHLSSRHLQSFLKTSPQSTLTLIKCMRHADHLDFDRIQQVDQNEQKRIDIDTCTEMFWKTVFEEINFEASPMTEVIDYITVIPTEAVEYIDIGHVISKFTHLQKIDGVEKPVLVALSNLNMQKVSVALTKISLHLISRESSDHSDSESSLMNDQLRIKDL